jgi:TonB-linked SusC/RagA family outer membrane protein
LIGTVSDQEGYFQIDVPSNEDIVQLSCIGYESSSIVPGQNKNVKVELNPSNHELKEVEIVYYKKPKAESINSAVSSIPAKRLERIPLNGIEHALQGNTAGVHVARNSGMPGSSLQAKVRGINSLINSDPIYLLDGIYIQQTSLYALSPHDIETIEILKDASSTAKYGASAGNGVVSLTSKKGNSKRTTATFDYYIGQQQAWKKPDLMSSTEFREFYELVRPWDKKFERLDTIYDTNWMEVIFHSAKTEDFHFAVSGGNNKSDFYIGSGYYRQSAIIKKLELNRYSFKIKSDHSISPGFKIGQDLSLAYLNFKGLKEGCFLNDFNNPFLGAMLMLPYSLSYDSSDIRISSGYRITNPYDDWQLTNNSRKNYSLFTILNSQVQLLPKVQYVTKLGCEVYFQDNVSYTRSEPAKGIDEEDIAFGNIYNILDLSFDWQHSIIYSTKFSADHSLNAMLGFEFGQNKSEWIPLIRNQYDKYLNYIEDTTGSVNKSYEEKRSLTEFSHHAYAGSINYEFKERYYLNLAFRRENMLFYSNNSLKNLSDLYPSFSAGWVFTKEGFFPQGLLKYAKLRYGWGKAGNSPRLNYSFYAKMMRDFEYVYAISSDGKITNSSLKRRTNEKFYLENITTNNIGLDLGLFDNRLFISVDYYNNHLNMGDTYQINVPKEFISFLNLLQYYSIHYLPVAEISNKGFEWELSYKHISRNLSWDLSLNLTHMENRLIDIDERELSYINSVDNIDPISVNIIGEAAGSFYGYRIERLFKAEDCDENGKVIYQPYTLNENSEKVYAQPEARAGDYKYVDINNDGIIDQKDRTVIGNPFPEFTFGLFYNLKLLNFDFSMFFQGAYGNDIFNATKLWLYNPYGLSNWTTDIKNSYREPSYDNETGEVIDEGNTDTDLHRWDYYNENKNLRISDFYVEDGSYIRLKNIQIGYTIKPELTKKIHIQKFRIYICAQNLFTITNYSGLDPEVGGWGIDCGIYPQPRVYMAGVNLEF